MSPVKTFLLSTRPYHLTKCQTSSLRTHHSKTKLMNSLSLNLMKEPYLLSYLHQLSISQCPKLEPQASCVLSLSSLLQIADQQVHLILAQQCCSIPRAWGTVVPPSCFQNYCHSLLTHPASSRLAHSKSFCTLLTEQSF